jgi:L-lactate dehydrogenase complex protein LldG
MVRVGAALAGRFTLSERLDRDALDALDFALTPATGAVAETGSLVLTDAGTQDRLAAIATWIHVGVLDPATVVPGVKDALTLAADDPYAVLVTGPSQTADVEGILIRGVHGPGEQWCLLWPDGA